MLCAPAQGTRKGDALSLRVGCPQGPVHQPKVGCESWLNLDLRVRLDLLLIPRVRDINLRGAGRVVHHGRPEAQGQEGAIAPSAGGAAASVWFGVFSLAQAPPGEAKQRKNMRLPFCFIRPSSWRAQRRSLGAGYNV